MRKNGFTLIELLAVIVILAIIALIATPIILGIINDAREKANERSVELYASAVKNGIAAYQLTSSTAPKSFSDLNVQYDGSVECTVKELYEDGSFYLEGCKINGSVKEYTYGTKQGVPGKMSICNPLEIQTTGAYTPGDKYECDVDPNKVGYDYTFYVLNSTSTKVNLIMDSNIRTGGEAVKEENPSDTGLVEWTSWEYLEENASQEDLTDWSNLNIYGPVTAMEYLQTATKDWTNTNPQTISTFTACPYGGGTCTDEPMAKTYTTNARLPYLSEVESTGCDIENYESGTCPSWMVDYLYDYGYQTHVVNGVFGYWTLSSSASTSYGAGVVYFDGSANSDLVAENGIYGVRPVINLSI